MATGRRRHEERVNEPTRLLHETRREAHYWREQCFEAQSGVNDDNPSLEYCQRMLHSKIESYWRLLRTPTLDYLPATRRDTDEDLNKVAQLWLERPLFRVPQGQVQGLYALRDWWESERVVTEENKSILSGAGKSAHTEPVFLSFEQSRKVLDRLDELAAELGLGYDHGRGGRVDIKYADLYPGDGPESLENIDAYEEYLSDG